MKTLGKILVMAAGLLVLLGAAGTDPRKQTVLIRSADVALHTEADTTLGHYYTVSYALPESLSGVELDRAMLEVFVDVSAKSRDSYVNESPILEVYALSQPYRGRLDRESFDPAGHTMRAVAVGSGRRVVFDVTGIVQSHLQRTTENNGLIMGSLTGMREGEFTFVSGRLPAGAVGQLLVYLRPKFVPVEVPRTAP